MSVISLPNIRTAHPLTGMTFYHGTRAKNIDSILSQGILPHTSNGKNQHACLTTDITCALYYGIIYDALAQKPTSDVAIITLPGETLNPDWLCVETGTLNISAYGEKLPGRDRKSLHAHGTDWRAFLDASSCVGVAGAIPVRPDWIDERFFALDVPTIRDLLAASAQGSFPQTQILDRLAQGPRWRTRTVQSCAAHAA